MSGANPNLNQNTDQNPNTNPKVHPNTLDAPRVVALWGLGMQQGSS